MGKRGPKAKLETEIGRRVMFYAKKSCDEELKALVLTTPKQKISPAICAMVKLANRHPEEFQQLLNDRSE